MSEWLLGKQDLLSVEGVEKDNENMSIKIPTQRHFFALPRSCSILLASMILCIEHFTDTEPEATSFLSSSFSQFGLSLVIVVAVSKYWRRNEKYINQIPKSSSSGKLQVEDQQYETRRPQLAPSLRPHMVMNLICRE